jgi:polysaccharide export outer membrane protein
MLAPARYHGVITGRAEKKANPATAIGTRFGTEIWILKVLSWVRGVARPAAIIALGLALVGCQALPGSGPEMLGAARGTTEALPFDVLDLTSVSVVPYRPVTSIDRPSVTGNLGAGGRASVAPGDVLKVRIFEPYSGSIFPTIQQPGADLGPQRVTDDGTINVPYAGTIQVAGLDLGQIEQRIVSQLGSKAQDPQVIVEFVADRTNTVMVSGEVKAPGRFSVLEGVRSVLDVINRAGGPAIQPPLTTAQLQVVVRRHGNVILEIQYNELLAGGDIPIQKGDEVVVRLNTKTFTALGAVLKSGNVEINKQGMTLLEALGAVGGLSDERANKTGVFVFRLADPQTNPGARSTVFKLDLMQPVSIFVAQEFGIQPKDVIYVTNAPLYEYNKILTALYRTITAIRVTTGSVTTTSF